MGLSVPSSRSLPVAPSSERSWLVGPPTGSAARYVLRSSACHTTFETDSGLERSAYYSAGRYHCSRRMHDSSRCCQYRHAHRWALHRWVLDRRSEHDRAYVPGELDGQYLQENIVLMKPTGRDLASPCSWSTFRLDPDDDLLGLLCGQLVTYHRSHHRRLGSWLMP
jgi:hypothetical protein